MTVLFTDVRGSMEFAERVDAEAWRAIMDRYFSLVCDGVHRYEGTVDKFTGDGAMALFGAPIAHEDHARRACAAALDLREALIAFGEEVASRHGLAFAVRIGINSGEVVVGSVGDDLHMDYTAIGHTVGLAARMQALAEPGRPYVARNTAALVEGWFELEDLGELHVKGVREPVRTYALAGVGAARSTLDAAAARGLSSFVGRGHDLAALDAALARSEASGQVVAVVAEPGLGKSRLCHEFATTCRARGVPVTVGRGVAHWRRIPLVPIIEMLRAYFAIGEKEDPISAREKVAGRLLALDDGFGELLPVLFDFLGIPDPDSPLPAQMAPEARQRALFAAVRRLVQVPAAEGPGVILVEDLHWLDPASDAFLADLIEALPGSRTLVLVNFRPEYRADWMQKSYAERLPLMALPPADITRLVRDLIGSDPSLDGVAELIAERTQGNPFFIEEVVQRLVEDGHLAGRRGDHRLVHSIDRLEIPATVQAVLAARIDRLPDADKAVLQMAAVIGHEFAEPVLRRVASLPASELAAALARLSDAELIYPRALYPEAQYAFKHPLTEEVAYRSQLDDRRARTHAAVARALEELYPGRLDELAALLANHWEQAHEPVRAAKWAARAAGWAGQSHPAEALRHWRRVRALLRTERDSQEARGLALVACFWVLQFGWRLGLAGAELEEVHREASELAAASDDTWTTAAALGAYASSLGMSGRLEEAIERSRRASDMAEQAGDPELRASIGPDYWLAVKGRLPEALAEVDARMALIGDDPLLGRRILGFSLLVYGLCLRAWVLISLGRLAEGRASLERGVELAREQGETESLGWGETIYGELSYVAGDPGDALARARSSVEIAERLGSSFSRVMAYYALSVAHVAREEWQDALAAVDVMQRITVQTGIGGLYEASALAVEAAAHIGLADAAAAAEAATAGIAVAVAQGTRVQEANCRRHLGRALTVLRPPDARPELERALALSDEARSVLVPHVRVALAELAAAEGDERERVAQLELAREEFKRQGAHGHVRRVDEQLPAHVA